MIRRIWKPVTLLVTLASLAVVLTEPASAGHVAAAAKAKSVTGFPTKGKYVGTFSIGKSGFIKVNSKPVHTTADLLAYVTGVCHSGTQQCWRQNHGATDIWPRDIAGDRNQQYLVYYAGQANQGALGGDCAGFGNVGAYTFQTLVTGDYIGAAYFSGGVYYVGEDRTGQGAYDAWVWQSNGVLENCGDSVPGTAFALLTTGANYTQLYTANTGYGNAWTQVNV